MKIAIPSSLPHLDGTVEQRLGVAPYMLLVETDDMSFSVVEGAGESGPGAGIAAITLAVNMGAQAILAGYAAPHVVAALEKQSIHVVTGCSGTVGEAVAEYVKGLSADAASQKKEQETLPSGKGQWVGALLKGKRQFFSLLPRLVGVVLLLGLFRGFVDEQTLLNLLSGSTWLNAIWGAALGSMLAGNPVNSYVIGDNLFNSGVGLAGGTALMLAWVNVGVIQLPMEVAALGRRFALVRNFAAFVMAVVSSLAIAMLMGAGR